MKLKPVHHGSCHCGAIEFEVDLPEGLRQPRRCNCSICSRHGAVVASASLDQLRVIKGQDILSLYQFNTFTAKHYFCSRCGIYTHHQRRSHPDQFSFNIACLDGVNIFDIDHIEELDGISHPNDRV